MERLSPESEKKKTYLERLKGHDCIINVEEGMDLRVVDYPLSNVPEKFETLTEGLRDRAIAFLNANIVADSFSSHDERLRWYNDSGLSEGDNFKFYLSNKLRVNILQSFMQMARIFSQYATLIKNRTGLQIPVMLLEMSANYSLKNYDQKTVEEKLALVAEVEKIAKTALNELIEFDWIEGEKV